MAPDSPVAATSGFGPSYVQVPPPRKAPPERSERPQVNPSSVSWPIGNQEYRRYLDHAKGRYRIWWRFKKSGKFWTWTLNSTKTILIFGPSGSPIMDQTQVPTHPSKGTKVLVMRPAVLRDEKELVIQVMPKQPREAPPPSPPRDSAQAVPKALGGILTIYFCVVIREFSKSYWRMNDVDSKVNQFIKKRFKAERNVTDIRMLGCLGHTDWTSQVPCCICGGAVSG